MRYLLRKFVCFALHCSVDLRQFLWNHVERLLKYVGFHRLVLGMSLILRPYSPKSSKGLIRPSRQSESFAVASLLFTDAGNPNKHRSWSDKTRFGSPLVQFVCLMRKTYSIHLIFIMTRIPFAHLELLIDENIEPLKYSNNSFSHETETLSLSK